MTVFGELNGRSVVKVFRALEAGIKVVGRSDKHLLKFTHGECLAYFLGIGKSERRDTGDMGTCH